MTLFVAAVVGDLVLRNRHEQLEGAFFWGGGGETVEMWSRFRYRFVTVFNIFLPRQQLV